MTGIPETPEMAEALAPLRAKLQGAGVSETITARELEEYFQRVQQERGVMGGAKAEAARIMRDIVAHREPEYERGQFYRDANGTTFFCLRGEGKRPSFSTMPEGKTYPHEYPKRPLRKLVPEGSARVHEAKIVDIITEYTDAVYACEAAERIFGLLEGGNGEH